MIDFKKLVKPYLIGEIGVNHNGDTQIAKKLIDACFACNWDCVKFQKRNPDKSVPEHQKKVQKDTPWGRMTYLAYKHKMEFGAKEYDYIDKYCREKPINWSMSVWDMDSLNFAIRYDLPFLKLPSAMLTNDKLLIESAKSGFPLIVSTGMSTLKEVDHAVELLEKYSNSYALLHTNSSYPTNGEDINLNVIPFLRDRYNCVVGYSGHEFGLLPSVISVSLGCKIIERHITLSQQLWGTDQASSVAVHGMDLLKKRMEEVLIVLGSSEKRVTEAEIAIRQKLRGIE